MEKLLIEKVRLHDILYNMKSTQYRNQHARQEAWEEIGRNLEIKAETAKNTWDKLRRCFLNAINRHRNKKSGDAAKKITAWKYEQQMAFLLPFLVCRKTESYVHGQDTTPDDINYDQGGNAQKLEMNTDETEGSPGQSNTIPQEEIMPNKSEDASQCLDVIKRKKRGGHDNPVSQMIDIMKKNACLGKNTYEERQLREMDETDMFFMSMAKMTKTLPPLEQAQIKLQLSNAVLQAQIRINEIQHRPLSKSSALSPAPSSYSVQERPP